MSERDLSRRLDEILASLGDVAVAFSAGADSTLLLARALRVLGPAHVLAVTADSPTLPRSELAEARTLAHELGARHRVIATNEIEEPEFSQNGADRCFFCKRTLFRRMTEMAAREGGLCLVYGATADDLGDHRPGMQAAREAGARGPLLEAGLRKADVRSLSREMGLRTWDKPAMACLSSRFPYGSPITIEGLARVEAAEEVLRGEWGLLQVRVRELDGSARIEVEPQDLPRLIAEPLREQLVSRLKALGYRYVTLDLQGFRSGSMNEGLAPAAQGGTGA